jgi:multidrug efflux pump subunit AcrA (membrane-fusion protein)
MDKLLMKAKIKGVLVCCLFFLVSGCGLLPREEAALKPPLVKPVKQNFEVMEVKMGSITKELKNSAIFVSSKKQDLFFKQSGSRLQSIHVKLGDKVKKGDVVAQLDPEDWENRIFVQKLMKEKAAIVYNQELQRNPNDTVSLRLKRIDVDLAQNELNRLNEQLDKTKLVSAIEGDVTYIADLKEGDYIPAFTTIASISDPKQVQLESQFSNRTDLGAVNVGMNVDVDIDSKKYKGHVLQSPSSAPVVADKDQQERNSSLIIVGVEGLPDDIGLGKYADIIIILEHKEKTLIIPRTALSSFIGREFVHVLEGESRKELDVEKGIVSSTEVEITKGLKEGQKVIINNN